MRCALTLAVVVMMVLGSTAMADETCEKPWQCGWWGLDIDWGDRGDDGSGIGLSARYGFPLGLHVLMIGLFWGDGNSTDSVDGYVPPAAGTSQAGTMSVDTDVWNLSASYVVPVEAKDFDWFYGGGVDWHRVDGPGWDDDSFGLHVLGGANLKDNWFVELRYAFATEFDWGGGETSDVDGIRLSVGRWFK